MQEVQKLYLIDQGVVFFPEGCADEAAGSLEFEEAELYSLKGEVLQNLAEHFGINTRVRSYRSWSKRDNKQVTHSSYLNDRIFPLLVREYKEHTAQVSKIEAKIDGSVIHVRITYFDSQNKEETWVNDFSYCGKYEIWWKDEAHDSGA
jgi:hypothetical protein